MDTLVKEVWKCEGVIGSRMTGAGFGVCNVSIMTQDAVEHFIKQVGALIRQRLAMRQTFTQ